MPKIVGIKFKKSAKVYFFEAGELDYVEGLGVIVETAKGLEYATVAQLPHEVGDDEVVQPLKPVLRLATERDEAKMREFEQKHDEVMRVAAEKIAECKLDMKPVDAEYSFDGAKLIIYFTADNRVDFRDLVRELASAFHTRIELRQIGARDECKMLGGIAPCGRACCCSDHMSEFAHVTIKMAKNQSLSLNPAKISGLCGKLMCCLAYENEHYAETNKRMPKLNSFVTVPDGRTAKVTSLNQLKEIVRVKIEEGEKVEFIDVPLDELSPAASASEEQRSEHKEQRSEHKEKEERGEQKREKKQKFERKERGKEHNGRDGEASPETSDGGKERTRKNAGKRNRKRKPGGEGNAAPENAE